MPEWLGAIVFLAIIFGIGFILPDSVHEIMGRITDSFGYISFRVMFWVPMLLWLLNGFAIVLLAVAILVPLLKYLDSETGALVTIISDSLFLITGWLALNSLLGSWWQATLGVGALVFVAFYYDESIFHEYAY